jgi:L-2-hydroxyglutarate oxidase LhgO
MSNADVDTDVLIVGAGPVGLFLFIALALAEPRKSLLMTGPKLGRVTS